MKKILDFMRGMRQLSSLVIDTVLIIIMLVFFTLMRGFGEWLTPKSFVLLGCEIIFFVIAWQLILRSNRSMWRYAEVFDYLLLIFSYILAYAFVYLINKFALANEVSPIFSVSVVGMSAFFSLILRMDYKWYYINGRRLPLQKQDPDVTKRPVAIIGAGNAGVSLMQQIAANQQNPYVVWGFFDDDVLKVDSRIHGVPVRGTLKDLPAVVQDTNVRDVIIAIPSLSLERRKEIITLCEKSGLKVKIMPDTLLLYDDKEKNYLPFIREIRIEDLLGRTTVTLGQDDKKALLSGRTVLVTGAGGSIGSSLCNQIAGAGVKKLVLFDIYENSVYDLANELKHMYADLDMQLEIGSMADKRRVENLFNKYNPEVVFHAAAHKHVPLMEDTPYEAVRNNIFGTYNLMTEALKHSCRKFVLISTDKAINPTNVMGATKRYCELMLSAMANSPECKTDFVAVRFGNVLGSNGSVVPLFQSQIKYGGPVTITDKRITRYFMTIPEATGLVIKAAAMAKKSEVFILDMGEPMKILELAENLIKLSGKEPYTEIPILETGLRPGEKLYEELLIDDEKHEATVESKIFVEKNSEPYTLKQVEQDLAAFEEALITGTDTEVLAQLKRAVTTFKNPNEVNAKAINQADNN